MFTFFQIDLDKNPFIELLNSAYFENITNGRSATVITNIINQLIPIFRTTTSYSNPPFIFSNIHHEIIQKIKLVTNNSSLNFNNALMEIYTKEYKKMSYHSDQTLDLDPNSFIAIFSCYNTPENYDSRKLLIQNKITQENKEIIMTHNSVILFPISENQKHLHKIILNSTKTDCQWLGVTFRLSKTFIEFRDNVPYFSGTNKELKYISKQKEFYKLRSEENKSIDFTWPEIDYTTSISDTFEPLPS